MVGSEDKEFTDFEVLAAFEADGSKVLVGTPVLNNVKIVAENQGASK
ncbi:MAG: hypothetical protein WCJ81_04460 [bacterium]